jgi:type II secretory pathway component PulM
MSVPSMPRLVAWDRASGRERTLVVTATIVIVLALFYGLAWPALLRDIERTRQDLARERATLAYLQQRMQPVRSTAAPPGGAAVDPARRPAADPGARAEVERVLAAHALGGANIDTREGQLTLVLAAAPFDPLVAALVEITRTTGLRVIEARLAARVEPGTVRAELALAR